MPLRKSQLIARPSSEDRFGQVPEEIPASLVDAIFDSDSQRKLPRAVMVGKDDVVVYQTCKAVSAADLKRLDELTTALETTKEIQGLAGKEIHKVILAGYCDGDIRLRAMERGINVLTKDELLQRRNLPVE
jgi:hypothetical protein